MTALILFGTFLFHAAYLAGNMTTLQIQHYGIYPFVGRETFKEYMQANNKSACIPSILPAMLLLLVNILLLFIRPQFITEIEVILFRSAITSQIGGSGYKVCIGWWTQHFQSI